MPKRNDDLLIADILDSMESIFEFIEGTHYEEFNNDRKTKDAVVRNLEIIGEASKNVSEEFKITHPIIEWKEMTSFRNRLIHDYFGTNYQIVWSVINEDLVYNYELLKRYFSSQKESE